MGEFLACLLIFMTFFFNMLFWFGPWDAFATLLLKLHPKLDLRVLKDRRNFMTTTNPSVRSYEPLSRLDIVRFALQLGLFVACLTTTYWCLRPIYLFFAR